MPAVTLHRAPAVSVTPAYEHELRPLSRVALEGFANHAMLPDCALDLPSAGRRSERLGGGQSRRRGAGPQGERLADRA